MAPGQKRLASSEPPAGSAQPGHRADSCASEEVMTDLPPLSIREREVMDIFGGSVEGAVATLLELEDTRLTPGERARMKALIDRASEEGR